MRAVTARGGPVCHGLTARVWPCLRLIRGLRGEGGMTGAAVKSAVHDRACADESPELSVAGGGG